jgi:hypothetical protein
MGVERRPQVGLGDPERPLEPWVHAVGRRDGLQRSAGQPAGRLDAYHALLGR